MEGIVEESENDFPTDCLSLAIKTERIFVWLRKNDYQKKSSVGKNNYFQRQYFFPIFLWSSAIFLSFLIVLLLITLLFIKLEDVINAFATYAVIAVFAAVAIGAITTFVFQKHQENEIEQFSQLGEISRQQIIVFELQKSFGQRALKSASIHLKKEIDSFNDLLAASRILLSFGVLLGVYGMLLDSFLGSDSNSAPSQRVVLQVAAGFIFISGSCIGIIGYVRLQKLREWQTLLELSSLKPDA